MLNNELYDIINDMFNKLRVWYCVICLSCREATEDVVCEAQPRLPSRHAATAHAHGQCCHLGHHRLLTLHILSWYCHVIFVLVM